MTCKPEAIRLIQERAGWDATAMELRLLRFVERKGQLTQLESFLEDESNFEEFVAADQATRPNSVLLATWDVEDEVWDVLDDEEELDREPEED